MFFINLKGGFGMTWWREYTKKRTDKEKREVSPRRERALSPFFGRAFFEDPWSAFESMHSEMDDMFSQVFSNLPEAARFREPLADIRETDNEVKVTVELPGVRKEDINVHVEGDVLAIEAASEAVSEKEEGGFYRRERGYSSFRRAFSLPSEVHPDRSKAMFRNGILEVALPKKSTGKSGVFSIRVD